MAYLLDTNAVIALMKNHPRVVERTRRAGRSELFICAPVEAELWFGVNKSSRVDENRRHLLTFLEWLPSIPFSGEATRLSGEIRADLARKGTPSAPTICRLPPSHLRMTVSWYRATRTNSRA